MASVDLAQLGPAPNPVTGPLAGSSRAVQLVRRPSAIAAISWLMFVTVIALAAPALWPHPNQLDLVNILAGPSRKHWLGTDELGRDLLSRIAWAGRFDLRVTIIATAIALLLGLIWGAVSAIRGRWLDEVMMRIVDIALALPSLILALILAAAFGASTVSLTIIPSLLLGPWVARVVRAAVLSELELDYCVAAKAGGMSTLRLFFTEILPNITGVVSVQAAFTAGNVILLEATLAFVGLGIQPPATSWGLLLQDGYNHIHQTIWYGLFPGLLIFSVIFATNILADNLQAVMDPRDAYVTGESDEELQLPDDGSYRFADRMTAAYLTLGKRSAGDAEPVIKSGSAPLLQVRNLRVSFPAGRGRRSYPVRGVSFDLLPGQRIGLVGESGAGKTLTGLSVLGLVPRPGRIEEGSICLEGVELVGMPDKQMARIRGGRISLIAQNPLSALDPLKRVGSQIVEAIRAHESVPAREARVRAIDLLEQVGIPLPHNRVDSYPHEFSGGMRQRIVIAMALSTNPAIVVADEPTSSLDVTTQAKIMELLAEIVEQRQLATILITHDLALATEFCSDILVMYAGRVVEGGDASMFAQRPIHPYSEGLERAICALDADLAATLPTIGGAPPGGPAAFPAGCAFHPRCALALPLCSQQPPVAEWIGGDRHLVECHLAKERV